MKLKYGIGDIWFNLALENHWLLEDIKIIERIPVYCVRCLETGTTKEYRAYPLDKYAHIVKVA